MTSGVGESFTCARCGVTFTKGWSDEEALAEAVDLFGPGIVADDQEVVCDDCYEVIVAWGAKTGVLDEERARLRGEV